MVTGSNAFKNVESMKRARGKETLRKSPRDNPDGARSLRGNRSVDSKIVKGSNHGPAISPRESSKATGSQFLFHGSFLIGRVRALPFANLFIDRTTGCRFLSLFFTRPGNLIRSYVLPFQWRLILWSLTVMLVISAILLHSFCVNLVFLRIVMLVNSLRYYDQLWLTL